MIKLPKRHYIQLAIIVFLLIGGTIVIDAFQFGVPAFSTLSSIIMAAIGWIVQIKKE